MEMEISIEDRVVSWLINKKIKGFKFIDFSDCARDICLDLKNKYHIKKIDKGFNIFNKRINKFIINFYEENN